MVSSGYLRASGCPLVASLLMHPSLAACLPGLLHLGGPSPKETTQGGQNVYPQNRPLQQAYSELKANETQKEAFPGLPSLTHSGNFGKWDCHKAPPLEIEKDLW